ncbi:MAG: glycoside hydrolase family 16 protein [bacterium]
MRKQKNRNGVTMISFLIPFVIASIFNSGCSKDESTPTDPLTADSLQIAGYQLIWDDEFNGAEIDKSKWEHEVNGHGGGNNELQYYTDRAENSFIQNGKLVIAALQEEYTGDDGTRYYTSARLRTANKGDWKYGRLDIRAKLPYGQGLWPAIWMLPTDWSYGGWPTSGEIDIMELLGQEPDKVYGTLHYGGSTSGHQSNGGSLKLSSGSFAATFHTFTIEWEENVMRWYVDDHLFYTSNEWSTDEASYPAPFDQRFHLILNVAVGGNWPGNPTTETIFPQKMEVEYVRVYKKK